MNDCIDQIMDFDVNIGFFCCAYGIDQVSLITNDTRVPTKQYNQTKFDLFLSSIKPGRFIIN